MTTKTKVVLMVLGTVLALTAAMFASPLLGVIGLDKAYAAMTEKPISSEFVCPSNAADPNCGGGGGSGSGSGGSNGSGGSTGGGSTDDGSGDGTCVPGVCISEDDGTPDGGTKSPDPENGNKLACSVAGAAAKAGCEMAADKACELCSKIKNPIGAGACAIGCTVGKMVGCDQAGDSVEENCLHPKPTPKPHEGPTWLDRHGW